MRRKLLIFITILSVVVSLFTTIAVYAANTITAALGTSDCNFAFTNIDLTLDSAAVREGALVSLSDGTVLQSFEHSTIVGTTYSGSFSFATWTPQPVGTIISLYGYVGQTPPSAADSVEFFIAYRCGAGGASEVVASCAGVGGSCPHVYTQVGGCANVHDGRLNNSSAVDCAAPIVLFDVNGRLDVYGVGGGESRVLFSVPIEDVAAGGSDVIADTPIPATGEPVRATLQAGGSLLLEAFYEDGKPYTILYQPGGSPEIVHLAW